MKPQKTGSRYLYESFQLPENRADIVERLLEEKWTFLNKRLDQVDAEINRLDRRLWVACFGIAMVLMTEAIMGVLTHAA